MSRDLIINLCGFGGLALVGWGCALIGLPWALISVGLLLFATSVIAGVRQ